MDPMLFGVDGELVFEVLGTIVLLSLFIERALSVIFEWRPLIPVLSSKGLKEPIAFAASAVVCFWKDFDALAIIFRDEKTSIVGLLLTALIVAGGSKGSVKLFRDFFNWKSNAYRELEAATPAPQPATRAAGTSPAATGAGQPS